jgi:steroid delta-isomerase-like uncharacterized protein
VTRDAFFAKEFDQAVEEMNWMRIPKKRLAVLREHIKAESTHNMEELLEGMTADCFNDVCCVSKPFVGPKRVAERYTKHWAGFPDFKVRVKRFLAADDKCIVTENEWSGTHRGTFLGLQPTGKRVRVRALVVWHFRGNKLWGETVFFDMGSIQKQIGAKVAVAARGKSRSG